MKHCSKNHILFARLFFLGEKKRKEKKKDVSEKKIGVVLFNVICF